MTIQEILKARCLNNGLFDSQAKSILQMTFDEGDIELKSHWNDNANNYNEIVIDVFWIAVCRNAIKFIDKNCPKHWARNVFVIGAELCFFCGNPLDDCTCSEFDIDPDFGDK